MTAEADSFPTDREQLPDDYGLVKCHSSNDLSVHARIDSTGYVRLLWESNQEDDEDGHPAVLGVKIWQTEGVTLESLERSAEQLSDTLESVAMAVEGSDLGTTEDNFVPTARCINDTMERQ